MNVEGEAPNMRGGGEGVSVPQARYSVLYRTILSPSSKYTSLYADEKKNMLLLSDLYASRKSAAVSALVSPASSAASAAAKRLISFEINNHDWMEEEVQMNG